MKTEQVVSFKAFYLEKHVEEALILAAILSKGSPVNAAHIIRAVIIIGRRYESDAFKKLNELLPVKDPEEGYAIAKAEPDIDNLELDIELFESYVVATEFWQKNKNNIWGRDLITLALLAKNDNSLNQLIEKEGKNIAEIRNQWYYYVTSNTVPHELGDWTMWWEKAGISIPSENSSSDVKTYLLLWNPKVYSLEQFNAYVRKVRDKPDNSGEWRFGNRKNANEGDKVFLIRHGSDKAGLVGYGSIMGNVIIRSGASTKIDTGSVSNSVSVRWERIQEDPIVPMQDLETESGETQLWHSQAGGVSFSDDLAKKTYEIWKTYVERYFLKLKTNFFSDSSDVTKDLLGYRNYSKAISEIIKDNTGSDPFNIGIIAPWGHGKTTLMKFIREDLEPQYQKNEQSQNKDHLFTSIKQLRSWLTSKKTDIFSFSKVEKYHPTVWFNAWKYQSSEQIWAGIGHAIVTQLVEKLEPIDQEKYWYQLKLPHIDRQAIQRKIFRYVLNNLPFTAISVLLTVLFGVGSYALSIRDFTELSITSLVFGGGAGIWTFSNLKEIYNKLNTRVHGLIAEPVKAPDYTDKLGLYHQLTDDLQRVFDQLIDAEKPAVIFIDDLDRCSPEVIAEVIEAINLIMTNPVVGKHCYFIFGMDAQVIAATLEDKYKNLEGKLPGCEHASDSVGWYFLDKFIQLPFIIPIMQKNEKKKFLLNFFQKSEKSLDMSPEEKQEVVRNVEMAIKNQQGDKLGAMIKSETNPVNRSYIEQTVIEKRIKEYKRDSGEILEQLEYLTDYLSSSPREIKRYVNLLILHNVHQYLRYHMSLEVPSNKDIAKWLLISVKWPQMVRWIQWENEDKLVHYNTPVDKANKIDMLIDKFLTENPDLDISTPTALEKWTEFLIREKADSLKWLKDKQLIQVLMAKTEETAPLEHAIRCRVW
jgi:hypothetical protein